MTRLFDTGGNVVVCSVIKAEPNVVSQVIEQGNYKGIQLAAISMNEAKQRNVSKPLKGHFAKSGIEPKRYLHQCAVEDISSFKDNDETAEIDQAEDTVTILKKYIEGLTLPVDSARMKTYMHDVYQEAISLENVD